MRTALQGFLARPSALRTLRHTLERHESSTASCLRRRLCSGTAAARRLARRAALRGSPAVVIKDSHSKRIGVSNVSKTPRKEVKIDLEHKHSSSVCTLPADHSLVKSRYGVQLDAVQYTDGISGWVKRSNRRHSSRGSKEEVTTGFGSTEDSNFRYVQGYQPKVAPEDLGLTAVRYVQADQPTVKFKDVIKKYDRGLDGEKYWAYLLAERERLHGLAGVQKTWQEMRSNDVDLPCHGLHAQMLWDAFSRHPEMFNDIYLYAIDLQKKTGQTWNGLYHAIVGHALRLGSMDALKWHRRFYKWYTPTFNTTRGLVRAAISSAESLWVFKKIYHATPVDQRFVYNSLLQLLRRNKQFDGAARWHRFLIEHDDHPKNIIYDFHSIALHSETVLTGSNLPKQHAGLPIDSDQEARADQVRAGGHESGHVPAALQMVTRMLGMPRNTEPSDLSDSFCARLFATTAFPMHSVIQGIAMFNVERIGPLTLRELAVRAGSAETLAQKLKVLKENGIRPSQDTFSRLVCKLTEDDRPGTLIDFLRSDHHPDVFDDEPLVRRLLAAYIDRQEWQDAHRMLLVLTFSHQDPEQETWNIILRHHAEKKDTQRVKQVMRDMERKKLIVTQESLIFLRLCTLTNRRDGRRPSQEQSNDGEKQLLVMINVMQSSVQKGVRITSGQWREVIKRLGMTEQIDELHRLLLWLAEWYSKADNVPGKSRFEVEATSWQQGPDYLTQSAARHSSGIPSRSITHPLRKIFRPVLIQAIIEWSFKTGFRDIDNHSPHAHVTLTHPVNIPPPSQTYLKGLVFLYELLKKGVWLYPATIQRALTNRLWILYAPGVSDKPANRRARSINPYTLEQMVYEIKRAWPHWKLFPNVDEEALHMLSANSAPTENADMDAPHHGNSSPSRKIQSHLPKLYEPSAPPTDDSASINNAPGESRSKPNTDDARSPTLFSKDRNATHSRLPSPQYTPARTATSDPSAAPKPLTEAAHHRALAELAIAVFGPTPLLAGRGNARLALRSNRGSSPLTLDRRLNIRHRRTRMNARLWPQLIREWMRRRDEGARRTSFKGPKSGGQTRRGASQRERERRAVDGWVLHGGNEARVERKRGS